MRKTVQISKKLTALRSKQRAAQATVGLAAVCVVISGLMSCGGGGADSSAPPSVTAAPVTASSISTPAGAPATSAPSPLSSNPAPSAPSVVTPPSPSVPSVPNTPSTVPSPTPPPAPAPSDPGSRFAFTDWASAYNGTITAPPESAYTCKNVSGSRRYGSTSASPASGTAFEIYNNDCVMSVQVDSTTINQMRLGTYNVSDLLQRLSLVLKDEVDVIVLLLDTGLDGPGTSPFYGRYTTFDTRLNGRERRVMGVLDFPFALGAIASGPFLHEFFHEWANNGVLPNEVDSSHWGLASVGGQLGGFKLSTLRQPDPARADLWQAGVPNCTPTVNAPQNWIDYCNQTKPFGEFANGGNSITYAPLELWMMGLIADTELPTVQVARTPIYIEPPTGKFVALGWDFYSASTLRAQLGARAPDTTTSQKRFRAATLVLTPNAQLAPATLTRIVSDIELMQFRGTLPAQLGCSGNCYSIHNLFTATQGRMNIAFGDLGALVR